ncbi:MAG: extracellular solute-binding protein [Schleiferilactobacillus perolens]|jgi:multiple sugar transport system substrate-binding protein|uniref:extracellular solute-binding protein n=1 Tax=Schleiferilactobacillus perolens TaxID=100468 RepID=UPI0039E9D80E
MQHGHWRRWAAGLVAVSAAVMVLLSGCGKQTAAQSTKKVQIEFWYGLGSDAGKEMESIISDFNKSQNQVTVKGVQQPDYDTTWQKVQAGLAAKKAPAVFLTDPGVVQNYGGSKGVLRDLTADVQAKSFNASDLLPVFTKDNKVDGHYYGVPAYGTTQIIYYNKKVLEKAGVSAKSAYATWENVAEAAATIKQKAGTQNGHMIMWGPDNLEDMALSNGGSYLSKDGKKVAIDSQAWISAWEFARKQIWDTKNMAIISGGQGWAYWYKTIDAVMHSQAGSYTGSSGDKANLDFSYIDAAEQPGMNGHEAKPEAGALSMALPKTDTDAQAQAAFKWISYFLSKKVQGQWSMKVGYVPVRQSTNNDPDYKKYVSTHPYQNVAFEQAKHASPEFIDPTKGKITDILKNAADQVELQNKPAATVLKAAAKQAQAALDAVQK